MTDAPRPRFTLAGLFELITGVAIGLALVAKLGWTGWLMTVTGLVVLVTAHQVIAARQRGQRQVGFLVCVVVATLAAAAAIATILGETGYGFGELSVLPAAGIVFLVFAIARRVRMARRMREVRRD